MSEMVSAAMSVNHAMVSIGQNEVVERFAGWAGIHGMSFERMPELASP